MVLTVFENYVDKYYHPDTIVILNLYLYGNAVALNLADTLRYSRKNAYTNLRDTFSPLRRNIEDYIIETQPNRDELINKIRERISAMD
jgi:hypothetical protein